MASPRSFPDIAGVDVSRVCLCTTASGQRGVADTTASGQRGVAAARHLRAHERVLAVPSALHLTAASLPPPLSSLLAPLAVPDVVAVALALLHGVGCRDAGSPAWLRGYCATLPRAAPDFVGLPHTWPASALALLCDADMARVAAARRNELRATFLAVRASLEKAICAPSDDAERAAFESLRRALSWRSFSWAVCCVQSRCFFAEDCSSADNEEICSRDGAGDGAQHFPHMRVVMVPLADLFNHHAESVGDGACAADPALIDSDWEASGGDGVGSDFVLRSLSDVRAGRELCLSYGDRCGRDLLETYGFLLPLRQNAAEALVLLFPPGVVAEALDAAPSNTARAALLAELCRERGGAFLAEIELCGGPLADDGIEDEAVCHAGDSDASLLFFFDEDEAAADADAVAERKWAFDGPSDDSMQLLRLLCFRELPGCVVPELADFRQPLSRDNELACASLLLLVILDASTALFGSLQAEALKGMSAAQAAGHVATLLVAEEAAAERLDFEATKAAAAAAAERAQSGDAPPWSGLLPSDEDCEEMSDADSEGASDAAALFDSSNSAVLAAVTARVAFASLYRRNRARIVLLHLQHLARLLQFAEGRPASCVVTPGATALRRAARRRLSRRRVRAAEAAGLLETVNHVLGSDHEIALVSQRRNARLMTSASDVTGSLAWPSTSLLAGVIAAHPALCEDRRVVELGCGTALLAASAAKFCSARCVVATDGEAGALVLARHNLEASAGPGVSVDIARLPWGEDGPLLQRVLAYDAGGQFDVAFAGEVFYLARGQGDEEGVVRQCRALFASARRLLRPCGCAGEEPTCAAGALFLIYTPRYRGMQAALLQAALELGLVHRAVDVRQAMTVAQRASHCFTDARICALGPCARAVDCAMARLGVSEGVEGCDADFWA